jgi:hypothetical protein
MRFASKGEHLTQLLTLWRPNYTCAEERWDLAILH